MEDNIKQRKKSIWLWWIISPTFKIAEHLKGKFTDENELTQCIIKSNKYNLIISIVLLFASTLTICLLKNRFGNETYLASNIVKYIYYFVLAFISWFFLISRSIEIFKSFLTDAIEKLNNQKSKSNLKFGDRLKLAFNSYLELILNFGTLLYLLPSSFIKGEINSIFDAVYFSGVTITTLGYGDYSPVNFFLKMLSIFEVLVGFSLIVVSFTVYTSLAINSHKPK